jgi:hypothetical protein
VETPGNTVNLVDLPVFYQASKHQQQYSFHLAQPPPTLASIPSSTTTLALPRLLHHLQAGWLEQGGHHGVPTHQGGWQQG